jgi:hypothetical protein
MISSRGRRWSCLRRRGRREIELAARLSERQISAVPLGLVQISGAVPHVETLGYCRAVPPERKKESDFDYGWPTVRKVTR